MKIRITFTTPHGTTITYNTEKVIITNTTMYIYTWLPSCGHNGSIGFELDEMKNIQIEFIKE